LIRAVIFDVDGTLVDTNDLHAASWAEAFLHFGHRIPQDRIRHEIGKGGDTLMPALLPRDALERQGEGIEAFRKDLFMREYLPRARAFPEVPALFRRIRAAGQKIVLASSSSAEEVERYTGIAGIADLIDATTTKDDAEHSKPFPDIFQAALERLAPIPAEAAVVVGDTPYDAEAAREAGITPVGVLSGGFSEEALRAAGCVAVYGGPQDLLARYEESPLAGALPSPPSAFKAPAAGRGP
jgi:HAD superfamily hydrolase (TIGR01509 family)